MTRSVDRRSVLLLGAAAVLSGCTDQAARQTSTPPSHTTAGTATGTTSPPASPSGVPALPRVSRWHPDPADLAPRAKLVAVRAIENTGNGPRSALQVLDAQYGGLLAASASVLVVCRSWHRRGRTVTAGGATYDVRLRRGLGGWRVTAVHPSRPGPVHRPLSGEERAVLASSRIELPPAARADVLSGQVHASVLTAMLRLSERYRVGVSVVRSGHPLHVFGTDRLSDHPRGRAFDTCRIDGALVVARTTPRRLVTGYMEAAAAAGAYNVGGPYLLGAAPQFFSDGTHHDHVHAGFPS